MAQKGTVDKRIKITDFYKKFAQKQVAATTVNCTVSIPSVLPENIFGNIDSSLVQRTDPSISINDSIDTPNASSACKSSDCRAEIIELRTQLKTSENKYSTMKAAYTRLVQMAHQKDIKIDRLKELVVTLKNNRKEQFNFVEFNHRFTATQLKSFATMHGGIRYDASFVRLILEAMYDELPKLCKMDQNDRGIITSMLIKRLEHFSKDDDELVMRSSSLRINRILSDVLFKLRKKNSVEAMEIVMDDELPALQ